MPDQDLNRDHSELISRYLSGNATDAEVQQLETWVLAAPENKAQFVAFKKAWMLSGMEQRKQEINVDQVWNQTADQLFEETKIVELQPNNSRRNWLRIAAGIALIVAAGIWIFQNFGEETQMVVNTTNEVKKFKLPDGSKITLNQSSSLAYQLVEDTDTSFRSVDLEGDAFFEVARDESRPFIIRTQEVEVEVLGTSFYIDSRQQQNKIEVTVQSGSVAVRYDTQEEILATDEKAIFRKEEAQLSKTVNDDPNYRSIQTNTLIFDKRSLEDVVATLERHFNVEITVEIRYKETCELDARYENKSLEDILELGIEGTLGIEVERAGNQITFLGDGCN